jgi:2-methylcitrate dehydratase PrpD
LLAAAQAGPPLHGAELLASIAIGCDFTCRLGLSLRRPLEEGGWYPPPILGAFGAVAAVARVRRLDARQLADAFSLVLCQISVPGEIKHSRDTVLRAVRDAFPARAAVEACSLAGRGVRGFESPFEGEEAFFRLFAGGAYDERDLLEGLGERYWIDSLTFKRWPTCRGTHAYIEAARALRDAHGFAAGDVESVMLEGGETQRMLIEPLARKRAPQTAIDAKFSLPFTVATALLLPDVTLEAFEPGSLAEPGRCALANRVNFRRRADWGRERSASGVVELELRGGRRLRHEVAAAVGGPDHPLEDAQLVEKFVDCVGRARQPLDVSCGRRLAARVLGLWHETDAVAALADAWS